MTLTGSCGGWGRPAETGADEVMISFLIHSHPERLRSYELLADVFELDRTGS
ncbi:MAG TPA: hypothetical protein VEW48_24470 [Thermoanaerobaculia bacterium]|nr:hypothetical protein [Thermoanaerobaculia bacterium]